MLLEKMVVFPISPGQGKLRQLPHLRLQLVGKGGSFSSGQNGCPLSFPLVTLCVLQGRILITDWSLVPRGWRKTWHGSPAAQEEIKGWREGRLSRRDWMSLMSLRGYAAYDLSTALKENK